MAATTMPLSCRCGLQQQQQPPALASHSVVSIRKPSSHIRCFSSFVSLPPSFVSIPSLKFSKPSSSRCVTTSAARILRPVEERFKILVDRNISEERVEELGVKRWAKWESDDCAFEWEWKVDEQIYIVKGSVQVTPEECKDSAWFYAGDLVRFPKWFIGTLSFDGEYECRYRFLAYGDD